MSESLKRELEEAADQLTEAMDAWEKARRYRENLAVELADSLLVYGEDVSGIELYRQAKESEEAKYAFLGLMQANALEVAQAWRDYKRTAETKEPSPAATGEGGGSLREDLRECSDRLLRNVHIGESQSGDLHPLEHEFDSGVLGGDDLIQNANLVGQGVVGKLLQREVQLDIQPFVQSQSTSLSVDGAPYGAGIGTSESTERGQRPAAAKPRGNARGPAKGDGGDQSMAARRSR